VTTAPRRRGPAPRFSREQLVDAAVAVVEADGFSALSLRSVARRLEVGPMTLYTYVDSSEELAALVVDRLVGEVVEGLRLPRTWRAVLRLLAKKLDALVTEHPAMVEAFGRGMVGGRSSNNVGHQVVERLVADGLTTRQAAEAYLGVHALVLGCAVLRAGAQEVPLDRFIETLLDGVAAGL
jgi:AcrR family transcriptional regulator